MSRAVASPRPLLANTRRAASSSLARFWAFRSSRRPAEAGDTAGTGWFIDRSNARNVARSRKKEDDLPQLAALGKAVIRLLDLVERERLRHRHAHRAGLDQRQHVALDAPHRVGL